MCKVKLAPPTPQCNDYVVSIFLQFKKLLLCYSQNETIIKTLTKVFKTLTFKNLTIIIKLNSFKKLITGNHAKGSCWTVQEYI